MDPNDTASLHAGQGESLMVTLHLSPAVLERFPHWGTSILTDEESLVDSSSDEDELESDTSEEVYDNATKRIKYDSNDEFEVEEFEEDVEEDIDRSIEFYETSDCSGSKSPTPWPTQSNPSGEVAPTPLLPQSNRNASPIPLPTQANVNANSPHQQLLASLLDSDQPFVDGYLDRNVTVLDRYMARHPQYIQHLIEDHLASNPQFVRDYLKKNTDTAKALFTLSPRFYVERYLNEHPEFFSQYLCDHSLTIDAYLAGNGFYMDQWLTRYPAFVKTWIFNNGVPSGFGIAPEALINGKAFTPSQKFDPAPPKLPTPDASAHSYSDDRPRPPGPPGPPGRPAGGMPQTKGPHRPPGPPPPPHSSSRPTAPSASAASSTSRKSSTRYDDAAPRNDPFANSSARQETARPAPGMAPTATSPPSSGSNRRNRGTTAAFPFSFTKKSSEKPTPKKDLITSIWKQPPGRWLTYPAPHHMIVASARQNGDGKSSWQLYEEDDAIKHMLNVRDEGLIKGEARFAEVSIRLEAEGIYRSTVAVKNFWNRYGRARSGFDERKNKSAPLATSKQGKLARAQTKKRKRSIKEEDSDGDSDEEFQGASDDDSDDFPSASRGNSSSGRKPAQSKKRKTIATEEVRASDDGGATEERDPRQDQKSSRCRPALKHPAQGFHQQAMAREYLPGQSHQAQNFPPQISREKNTPAGKTGDQDMTTPDLSAQDLPIQTPSAEEVAKQMQRMRRWQEHWKVKLDREHEDR